MTWEFQSDRPIYAQLIEQIKLRIATGEYEKGSRLASVRDMANEAAVNPNTMQRALAELEQAGLLYSVRTSGRFITENENLIKETKVAMANAEIKQFLAKMKGLGLELQEIVGLIESVEKEDSSR